MLALASFSSSNLPRRQPQRVNQSERAYVCKDGLFFFLALSSSSSHSPIHPTRGIGRFDEDDN